MRSNMIEEEEDRVKSEFEGLGEEYISSDFKHGNPGAGANTGNQIGIGEACQQTDKTSSRESV